MESGSKATFHYNGWLSQDDAPYKTSVELFPTGRGSGPGNPTGLVKYSITTYTSDVRGAGTDANVSCVILGSRASTPALVLENSKDNFERGQVDCFVVESVDVGCITRLQIIHDNRCVQEQPLCC